MNRLPSRLIVRTLGLSLLAAALLLSACGGAVAPAPSEQPAGGQSPEPSMTGGTLNVAAKAIVNVDPAQISADSEVLVANAVYDYLVDVDADNKVQPRLATDWIVGDDGLTYTFHLTHGASFHDGTPLTAKDVVYTFNRLRDPNSGFATVDLYGNIADIRADGDYSVVFTLKATNPFFLFDLSDNHALVVKDGTTDFTDFNGSGPFKVVSYTPEDRIEMDANSDYFQSGSPRVAHLNIVFFQDTSAAVDALRSGDVDTVFGLSAPQYKSLQGESGVQTYLTPTNAFPVIRLQGGPAARG